jgi:hypothetical protein
VFTALPLWGRYGETHILLNKEHIRMTTTPPAAPDAPAAKSPVLSIVSLILGILGFLGSFCFGSGFLFGAVAIVLGIIGRGKEPKGKGMALAGIITGALAVVGSIIVWIVLGIAAASSSSYYTY